SRGARSSRTSASPPPCRTRSTGRWRPTRTGSSTGSAAAPARPRRASPSRSSSSRPSASRACSPTPSSRPRSSSCWTGCRSLPKGSFGSESRRCGRRRRGGRCGSRRPRSGDAGAVRGGDLPALVGVLVGEGGAVLGEGDGAPAEAGAGEAGAEDAGGGGEVCHEGVEGGGGHLEVLAGAGVAGRHRLADRRRVAGLEGADERIDPGVLGDDVAGPATHHRVLDRVEVLEAGEAQRPHHRLRLLAGGRPL